MSEERTSRFSGKEYGSPGSLLQSTGADSATSRKQDAEREGRHAPSAKTGGSIPADLLKSRVLDHLDAICKSPSFESSKRSQQFLRYIVMETLEGRGDSIKERSIANEVFGRGVDFEPGEDSLVRVKARELRKRLSDYYLASPSSGLAIELPLGGYVPRICDTSQPAAPGSPATVAAKPAVRTLDRRRLLWTIGGSAGLLGAAAAWPFLHERSTPLERLWKPVFATKTPLVIFIPIVKERVGGALSDRVGIGPTAALRHAADFLVAHKYPYHLRFGADLTFAQLREQPSLLLGGFSSIWTQLLTRNLRFSLVQNENSGESAVVDTQTKQQWQPVNQTPEGYADQDYGILCRLFDKESGQIAMIAGGITTFGTEGAASVFFNPLSFGELVRQAPAGWEEMNFEAVIRVSVIGITPSSPQFVAQHFW